MEKLHKVARPVWSMAGGGRGVPQILQPGRMHPRRGTQDFPHAVLLDRRNSREGEGPHSFLEKVRLHFTHSIVHLIR